MNEKDPQMQFIKFKKMLSNSNKPVLVDFWANGCPPCDAIWPTLDKLKATKNNIHFTKINLDDLGDLVAPVYGIQAVPTLIIFEKGEIKSKIAKPTPEELIEFVTSFENAIN